MIAAPDQRRLRLVSRRRRWRIGRRSSRLPPPPPTAGRRTPRTPPPLPSTPTQPRRRCRRPPVLRRGRCARPPRRTAQPSRPGTIPRWAGVLHGSCRPPAGPRASPRGLARPGLGYGRRWPAAHRRPTGVAASPVTQRSGPARRATTSDRSPKGGRSFHGRSLGVLQLAGAPKWPRCPRLPARDAAAPTPDYGDHAR